MNGMGDSMSEPTETLTAFITRLGLKSHVKLIDDDDSTWTYKVTFTFSDRELTVEYEDYEDNPAGKVALEAIDEAANDAACIENSSNLWEWSKEYYDLEPHNPVIQNPEETYLIQRRRAKDLKAFLGDSEYHHLLFEVDRLYS